MGSRKFWLGDWTVGQWLEGLMVVGCIAAIEILWIIYVLAPRR